MAELGHLSVMGYENGGFAVVTNDDLLPAVVGYSDKSYGDGQLAEGFDWWLRAMQEAAAYYVQNNMQAQVSKPDLTKCQPELKFFYKLEAGSLVVKGWQPSGDETVFFTAQADGSDEDHWHSAVVNLTPLKQLPFVVVKFFATGQAERRIFIDDVDIYDGAYTDGIDNSQFIIHNSQLTIQNSQLRIHRFMICRVVVSVAPNSARASI